MKLLLLLFTMRVASFFFLPMQQIVTKSFSHKPGLLAMVGIYCDTSEAGIPQYWLVIRARQAMPMYARKAR